MRGEKEEEAAQTKILNEKREKEIKGHPSTLCGGRGEICASLDADISLLVGTQPHLQHSSGLRRSGKEAATAQKRKHKRREQQQEATIRPNPEEKSIYKKNEL